MSPLPLLGIALHCFHGSTSTSLRRSNKPIVLTLYIGLCIRILTAFQLRFSKLTRKKDFDQVEKKRKYFYLFAGLALPHCILQVDKPGPVEDEGGDGEDEVEGEVGPALVLAAVHQDEVADQEGETQHDVNISRIQTIQ